MTVAIEDTGQGALRATTTVWDGKGGEQSYVSDNGATDPIVAVVPFENAYNAVGQFAIEGSKKLTGRPLVADEFAFSLSLMPADGNTDKPAKEIEDIKNAADGSVVFASVSFDVKSLEALVDEGYAVKSAADTGAAWKLRYRVAEDLSALPDGTGAVSDSFEAQVTLTDDGKGVLNAVVTYPQQGGVIENAYAAGEKALFVPRGTKQLSYLPGLRPNDIAGKFTFTLEGEEGAPMPQAPGDTAVNTGGHVTSEASSSRHACRRGTCVRRNAFEGICLPCARERHARRRRIGGDERPTG
ncbi:MAG: Spy0128 family protein [Eggerthellaceae bacterium]